MMNSPFSKNLKATKKFQRLLGKAKEKSGLRSGLVVLSRGQCVGEHNTGKKKEILIILEGKAVICFGRKKNLSLSAHAFVFIPPNTIHDVRNIGPKKLKYVYITSSDE